MKSVFKTEIAFVRILLPYLAGIIAFYQFENEQFFYLNGVICMVSGSYLTIVNLSYKHLRAYRFKGMTSLVFYFFWFWFGGWCCLFNNQRIKKNHFVNFSHQYLKIRIADEPMERNNMIRFKAIVTDGYKIKREIEPDKVRRISSNVNGKLLVTIKIETSNVIKFNYGDEMIIPAAFSETEGPHNPAEFDYKGWLAAQNIYHQTFLEQKQVAVLKNNSGNKLIAFALKFRKKQIGFYKETIKNNDAFAFACTLILGYKADLNRETLGVYAKTGTIHALSVSGMHVGLVYFVLNWMLWFLDRKKTLKIVKVCFILSFIWFYALLTGLSPAVLRSAIMISVFIVAKSFNRYTNSYNIIAFAAFCLLVYDPFLIWDTGFQLSFLAVSGLIWLQPMIENWWHFKNKWISKLWSGVAMSLAAQLITFPFSVYYFHQFPVYFLLNNLFIMVPMALLMYLGISILIFRLTVLVPLFEWLINFTNKGLEILAALPKASISGIWLDKPELIMLCTALSLLIFGLSYFKKNLLFASIISLALFQSMLSYDQLKAIRQNKIMVFKLHNNELKAYISARRAVLVMHHKLDSRTYGYFVKPALDRQKVIKIDWIILN